MKKKSKIQSTRWSVRFIRAKIARWLIATVAAFFSFEGTVSTCWSVANALEFQRELERKKRAERKKKKSAQK